MGRLGGVKTILDNWKGEHFILTYFIIGTFLLFLVFTEIANRLKEKPLSILISQREESERHISAEEKKKKINSSFSVRAQRVNWQISKGYQQGWFILGTISGSVGYAIFSNVLVLLAGITLGIMIPYILLRSKEEKFADELPLRAEQAINAIEQQMQADIPIFHAIKAAIPFMQSPLKEEYQKAINKVEQASIPLKKALEDIPHRLDINQLEYFHMIVEIAEETEEKARDIVRDASDMLRRQQKHTIRYHREVNGSKKESLYMFYLIVVMVASLHFMLPDNNPMSGGPIQMIMNVVVIGITGWTTWTYRKKLQAKNLF